MRRHHGERERVICELSKTNHWYQYEFRKKHLSPKQMETEMRELIRVLKV